MVIYKFFCQISVVSQKNSIDAKSKTIAVSFDMDNCTITVLDDGCGMDLDIIHYFIYRKGQPDPNGDDTKWHKMTAFQVNNAKQSCPYFPNER